MAVPLASEPYVVASDLTLRYPGGTVPAVEGVSFSAARGEVVTLLGPSGCGKTTALRLLAGLEKPDAGSVFVGGRDVTFDAPERRRMGFVFQNYALFPHLDVAGNVAFGLKVRRASKPEIAEAVGSSLALVGLEGYEKRGVAQLSGGQQQRVALARALAIQPDVLLMDEPLSNLDTALREQTREALRELLSRLNVTTFFVTHDQSEAFAFSHHVVLMRAGHVVEAGRPEDLYRRPESVFAADFLGAANLLRAVVDRFRATVTIAGRRIDVAAWSDRVSERAREVTVVARGESLRVSDADEPNALPGRVVDSVFLGAAFRLTVTVEGLADPVRVYATRDHALESVWLVLPADALRAIESDA